MQAYTFVPLSQLPITSRLTVINVIYIKIRGHRACYLSFYLWLISNGILSFNPSPGLFLLECNIPLYKTSNHE